MGNNYNEIRRKKSYSVKHDHFESETHLTTPRQRALSALNHEVPDFVPAYLRHIDMEKIGPFFNAEDIDQLFDRLGNTIISFSPRYLKQPPGPYGRFCHTLLERVWGSSEELDGTFSDSFARPLAGAETISDIERFRWPSGADWDFKELRGMLGEETNYARLSPSWMPVFSRLCQLFGMERAMVNLHLAPSLIEAALEHIDQFYTEFYAGLLDECGDQLDIFGLGDDFAGNDGLLISPDIWRKLFKPLYAKWIGMAKSKGLFTFMHCCGNLIEVLPELIEIGLDAWQTVQTHLSGQSPQVLKEKFGSQLTFVGAIDTTNILWKQSAVQVSEHVRKQVESLGENGGYICAPDHTIMPEVPVENIAALYDTCRSFRKSGYTLL